MIIVTHLTNAYTLLLHLQAPEFPQYFGDIYITVTRTAAELFCIKMVHFGPSLIHDRTHSFNISSSSSSSVLVWTGGRFTIGSKCGSGFSNTSSFLSWSQSSCIHNHNQALSTFKSNTQLSLTNYHQQTFFNSFSHDNLAKTTIFFDETS